MSVVKRKVENLVDEDPELEGLLEYIIEVQNSKGEVEWKDVKNEATSGQWGRLIEKGILVESDGNGFVLNDEESVKDALGITKEKEKKPSENEEYQEEDEIDTSWSTADKAAGLAGLALIVFGYYSNTGREFIGGTVDVLAGPLHDPIGLPYYLIILVFATITGLYSSILQHYLMDWDWISRQQERVQEMQSQMKDARSNGDDGEAKALQEEQQQMMSEQMKMFKMQFKPSAWIMVITIPIFVWIYWKVGSINEHMIFPFAGEKTFTSSLVGPLQVWIAWYLLCSFGLGQVMRKVIGVNPST